MLRAQVNGPHQYIDLYEIIALFGHSHHVEAHGFVLNEQDLSRSSDLEMNN